MKAIIFVTFACFVAGSIADTVSDSCSNCHTVIGIVQENFHNASREYAFQNFQQVCGQNGKLSGTCKNINATFFNEIYKHLETSLRPSEFCLMSRECSTNVVPVVQAVRSLPNGGHESVECELCKKLVKDVATNLTEANCHELLLNACKQMDSFQADCIHITDEYYSLLHDYLLDKLNLQAVCSFVGICPGPGLFGAAIPITVSVPKPVPAPVPIPVSGLVPVTSPPRTSSSHGGSISSTRWSPNFQSMPVFNLGQSPAYALAPLAALPALSVLPLFAIG